ncbi:hypothetical protein HAX54_012198, partial [Datura stramonium]|nr:hypothetical protein [Datura stramonium]
MPRSHREAALESWYNNDLLNVARRPLRRSGSVPRRNHEGSLEFGQGTNFTLTWHGGHRGGLAPWHGDITK